MFFGLLIHFSLSINTFNRLLSKYLFFIKNDETECYSNQTFSNSIFSNNVICIIQCTFNSLKSQNDGGAVVINLKNRFGVKNYIDQCIFTRCQSNNGGALYINIEKNFTTEIQNSIFKQNSANISSGGSIYIISKMKCNFEIKNCTLDTNFAIEKGGCIYLSNLFLSFNDCLFNMNKISSSFRSYGGAIHSQNSEGVFKNCTFSSNMINIADRDSFGGAISFSDSIASFQKCNFTNNIAFSYDKNSYYTSYFSYGGAISIYSSSNTKVNFIKYMNECYFKNNLASSSKNSYGGAIYISSLYDSENITFSNLTFINNTAYSISHLSCSGAIDISSPHKSANYSFLNSSFFNNTAFSKSYSSYGGAISFIHSLFSPSYMQSLFIDCIFMKNRVYAASSTEGGAVKLSGMIGLFKNCSLSNNSIETHYSHSYGGAVCSYNSNLYIMECKFICNTGFVKGGALFLSESIIEIKKSAFKNNKLIYNGSIFDSRCFIKGGSCYFYDSLASISDCDFTDNSVILCSSENSVNSSTRTFGGAIYSNGTITSLKCTNCRFNNNSVLFPGHKENEFSGAIYLTNGILKSCKFLDNSAYNGGDIKYDQLENSLLSIINCGFKHNLNRNCHIKSLFHFNISCNNSLPNIFINNQIVIKDVSYLFDGEIESESLVFKFQIKNNCISPFNRKFYKSNEIMIFNENGNELLPFETGFGAVCIDIQPDDSNKKSVQKVFIIIIIVVISIVIIIILLFLLKFQKKVNQNDIIEPLIDLT